MVRTVSELFRMLEEHAVRYAVLRNYELLPDLRDASFRSNTDIDLVVDSNDIPVWRQIAVSLAEQLGWDALTECAHWMRSSVRHHHIEVFRFYRIAPPAFLEVDLFHAYLTAGLPLMDERDLLEGRIYDRRRGLTRIDPLKENAFRLLQIHGRMGQRRSRDKVDRYLARIAKFCESHNQEFRNFLRRRFSVFGVLALDALHEGEMKQFKKNMGLAKASFAIRSALRHPFRAARYMYARYQDNRARYGVRQCGCVFKICAGEKQRRDLATALDGLVYLNFFDEWSEKSGDEGHASWHERKVMEKGGLVIQWSAPEAAQLLLAESDDQATITGEIIRFLIGLHPCLFRREPARAMH
jgi:hypothetical protein